MTLHGASTTIKQQAGIIDEANMTALAILIVDRNADICDGLCAILDSHDDIEIVAAVATVAQAIENLQGAAPDVVLVDAQVPDSDGVGEIRRIVQRWPTAKVIALAVHSSATNAALAAGADQVVPKDSGRRELLDAVRATTKPSPRET